jgi:hypothetical protein
MFELLIDFTALNLPGVHFYTDSSRTFRIPNYACDWQLATKAFYATAMAHWMAEHEIMAAAVFVGLSLALIAIFAALEHRYKQQLTARRKDYFS